MKAIKLSSLLLTTVLIVSCGSDDDGSTPEPTVFELLTAGRWYVESQTDLSLDDCSKQSNFRFLENGNFVWEIHGDLSGTCEQESSFSGTWELLSDDEMTITNNGATTAYTIITVSEDELVVNFQSGADTITTIFDKNPGDG